MSRILKEVHASAQRLHDAGLTDVATMREFDALCLPPIPAYLPADVRRIRSIAQASQTIFAALLNVGTTTVAAWERGTMRPTGAAAKLLNLVERKGLEILV
jgi:putative transcriptional regulator